MTKSIDRRLKIRLLGRFELIAADGSVHTPTPSKTSALLALLAVEPGKPISRKRLAALLWGDRGEEQARNSLRQAIHSLKQEFESLGVEALEADRDMLRLIPDSVSVDLAEFQEKLREDKNQEALDLYNGPLLDEFSIRTPGFQNWLEEARRNLDDQAITLFERASDQTFGAAAVASARKLLALDPLRESSHRTLMKALLSAGEREQALRQFEACCNLLRDELGIKPEPETRALYEQIAATERAIEPSFSSGIPLIASWRDQRTTLIVIPLQCLAGGDEGQMLAEGVSEDLITELARYKHLFVIGNRISSLYRGQQVNLEDIRRDLSADFVVEGSVRFLDDKVRVSLKLIDTTTGETAWAERFDRVVTAILELQDEIVTAIVARLSFNLDEAANRQRQRDQKASGSAYALFLKARFAWRDGRESEALEFAKKAVEIDPSYARAHAYIAYFYAYSGFSQWHDLPDREVDRRARDALGKALSLDKSDPFILQRAAMTLLMLGESDEALRYANIAQEVSACDSEILIIRGLILTCCGRYEEGVQMLERAVSLERRLSPGCFCALSEGKHMRRDYSGSLSVLDQLIDPPYYVKLMKAANLARLGRIDEARHIVATAPPNFDAVQFARAEARMCSDPKDKIHWLESFRLAGVDV